MQEIKGGSSRRVAVFSNEASSLPDYGAGSCIQGIAPGRLGSGPVRLREPMRKAPRAAEQQRTGYTETRARRHPVLNTVITPLLCGRPPARARGDQFVRLFVISSGLCRPKKTETDARRPEENTSSDRLESEIIEPRPMVLRWD